MIPLQNPFSLKVSAKESVSTVALSTEKAKTAKKSRLNIPCPVSYTHLDVYKRQLHVSAAFELDEGYKFLDRTVKLGATCSLAHSDATYDEAVGAVAHGVKSFTHTYNAMRPIHHREPGNMIASLLSDDAYSEFICDGEHSHPAMIELAYRAKNHDKIVLITDSLEAAGCPDGEYSIAGLPVYVKNGRAVNSEGALAGSTLDLFTAVKNFMRFTGATLEAVSYTHLDVYKRQTHTRLR